MMREWLSVYWTFDSAVLMMEKKRKNYRNNTVYKIYNKKRQLIYLITNSYNIHAVGMVKDHCDFVLTKGKSVKK